MEPISESDAYLLRRLRDAPREHEYRYTEKARAALLKDLFNSLSCHKREYLSLLFPDGPPNEDNPNAWNLSSAQGAISGAEYSAAARGKPCGHIFKSGEASYRCKTCSLDDTCVLCSRCFESSDHEGHSVLVHISPGNSGCCDCGDAEAWRIPVKCAIHTAVHEQSSPMETDNESTQLPPDLVQSIASTIGRALDYIIDVISCSPEQLRLQKTEEAIRKDEEQSRLMSPYYGPETESDNTEFCLVLWNDEKHTVRQVETQVSRACRQTKAFGTRVAQETDSMGRSMIMYSPDVKQLMKISAVIEHIKLTLTIRSARDTFREQMCGTIIEWLSDIAGCSVGGDHDILRTTICEQLLGVWRIGSKASNTDIGKQGIDDHAWEDEFRSRLQDGPVIMLGMTEVPAGAMEVDGGADAQDNNVDNEDEGEGEPAEGEPAEGDEDDVDMVGSNVGSQDEDDILGLDNRPLRLAEAFILSQAAQLGSDEAPRHGDDWSIDEQQRGLPQIPKTPSTPTQSAKHHSLAPPHWLEKPAGYASRQSLPHEDLMQRIRLDYLIMFDLRLWKKARIDLRHLYISTVVAIPQFKRILGLRFAGLHPVLAQLYLIADREPDHSIVNLSLQMLTTPSITAEIVQKGNFLTNLMAILYTFETTRQVSYPHQVNKNAVLAIDTGALTNPLSNRRIFHFFADMKYLLGSEYVQERLRVEPRYTLQFLDLAKLHQGICPNIRAVTEHVEYEADAWISASMVTRDINKLSRMFAQAFRPEVAAQDELEQAIRTTAKYAIINSMGWERDRFQQSEMKDETEFKQTMAFEFDTDRWGKPNSYKIVRFSVDKQSISFHHVLHYTLSWLIAAGRGMPVERMRTLLFLDFSKKMQEQTSEDLALAMFDIPLRVFVWLAQMKTGMWVRNGFSLRHQMSTYRHVNQRDYTVNRDVFLLQTALVVLDPSRMLANMIDRFGLMHWMEGNYDTPVGYEEAQVLDLAEEFLHLLIVIISDRLSLIPVQEEPNIPLLKIKRELAHVLCFKPMMFSEIALRSPEKLTENPMFSEVLEEMTVFKAPEGLSDSGTFTLKDQYVDEVDPYILQFSKNQREDTEHLCRARISKKTGKPEADVVFEPHLRPIKTGLFTNIAAFTKTPTFAQIMYYSLAYALQFKTSTPSVPASRVETFLHLALHLSLLAVMEDQSVDGEENNDSFILNALEKTAARAPELSSPNEVQGNDHGHKTIATVLHRLASMEDFKSCWPKINLVLRRMKEKKPKAFWHMASWASDMGMQMEVEETNTKEAEAERKKQLAKERQAKIMEQMKQQQQNFMKSAGFDFNDDDSDSDAQSIMTPPLEEHTWWKYPTGTCILCQEEMDDSRLYGTLALVIESNIFRQTDLTSPEYVYEVARNPESLDRPAENIRPYGVASMNHDKVKKMAPDGSEVVVERQGLGAGFPPDKVEKGPLAVGCNHLMHFSCFEHYYESTRRRHPNQIARNHPERLEKQEFVCPLCKALGNAFLPIVWRAKEETSTGVLQPSKSFDGWLMDVEPSVSRFEKSVASMTGAVSRSQEMFKDYSTSQMIASISDRLKDIPLGLLDSYQEIRSSPALASAFTPSLHGIAPSQVVIPSRKVGSGHNELEELHKIYLRLRDTFSDNEIETDFQKSYLKSDLTHCDSLARTLGFSISAVEIAQRGVGSEPGSTFLDRISPQVLTHLRILAETVSSYFAVGSLQTREATRTLRQFQEMQKEQVERLLVRPEQISLGLGNQDLPTVKRPLLSSDIFVFLAECSVCAIPALNWDVMHVLRLCYIAEIVKAIVAIGTDLDFTEILSSWERAERLGEIEGQIGYTQHQLDLFKQFLRFVGQSLDAPGDLADISSFSLAVFRHLVGQYVTPFLRKCVILLHTRYGVVFSPGGFADMEEPEQRRLQQVLHLPSVDEVFEMCIRPDDDSADTLRRLISGWCRHSTQTRVSLPHPAIFELVGLPYSYDVLIDEAVNRKCPTTGNELVDATLCLFCGDIFCSQAVCCMKDSIGGCNQHLQKCGKNVGVFINIRKCALLYLHDKNGSFGPTPYLDAHGETDMLLRRNRQLFLNQRRYDALVRNTWLQHGFPSVISRKLEADINTGGWETM